jgi:hypothetical protein
LASFHKIEAGMRRAEVTRILGAPPGNYTAGGRPAYFGVDPDSPFDGDEWVVEALAIRVQYDSKNEVTLSYCGQVDFASNLAASMRRRLGIARPLTIE